MIEGIVRESTAKMYTKSLRRDGYLIANIYGKGAENILCAFKRNEFIKAVKNKETLVFDVKVGDKTYPVVIQDYERNPVTNDLIHVDLVLVQKGVVTTFMVPVKTAGTPIGLKNKGVLLMSKRRIKVRCAAEKLPNAFVVDVSKLDVGDTLLVRDLEAIDGVEIRFDSRVPVVGIVKAK
jgi:large subunit ribosomal protein L25